MELVIKKTGNNYLLDTAPINRVTAIKPMNINHIIHALKTIKKGTSNLNAFILFIKTTQIIINYDPSYSDEIEHISEMVYNDWNIGYEIRYSNLFEWLHSYSLIQLLQLMKIKKEHCFLLINSLCMCNDILNISGGGAYRNIIWIYRKFFNTLKEYDIFLNALY